MSVENHFTLLPETDVPLSLATIICHNNYPSAPVDVAVILPAASSERNIFFHLLHGSEVTKCKACVKNT
jgi:hypothetical protein